MNFEKNRVSEIKDDTDLGSFKETNFMKNILSRWVVLKCAHSLILRPSRVANTPLISW